jgi:flagellar basal body-associated protein FliL
MVSREFIIIIIIICVVIVTTLIATVIMIVNKDKNKHGETKETFDVKETLDVNENNCKSCSMSPLDNL